MSCASFDEVGARVAQLAQVAVNRLISMDPRASGAFLPLTVSSPTGGTFNAKCSIPTATGGGCVDDIDAPQCVLDIPALGQNGSTHLQGYWPGAPLAFSAEGGELVATLMVPSDQPLRLDANAYFDTCSFAVASSGAAQGMPPSAPLAWTVTKIDSGTTISPEGSKLTGAQLFLPSQSLSPGKTYAVSVVATFPRPTRAGSNVDGGTFSCSKMMHVVVQANLAATQLGTILGGDRALPGQGTPLVLSVVNAAAGGTLPSATASDAVKWSCCALAVVAAQPSEGLQCADLCPSPFADLSPFRLSTLRLTPQSGQPFPLGTFQFTASRIDGESTSIVVRSLGQASSEQVLLVFCDFDVSQFSVSRWPTQISTTGESSGSVAGVWPVLERSVVRWAVAAPTGCAALTSSSSTSTSDQPPAQLVWSLRNTAGLTLAKGEGGIASLNGGMSMSSGDIFAPYSQVGLLLVETAVDPSARSVSLAVEWTSNGATLEAASATVPGKGMAPSGIDQTMAQERLAANGGLLATCRVSEVSDSTILIGGVSDVTFTVDDWLPHPLWDVGGTGSVPLERLRWSVSVCLLNAEDDVADVVISGARRLGGSLPVDEAAAGAAFSLDTVSAASGTDGVDGAASGDGPGFAIDRIFGLPPSRSLTVASAERDANVHRTAYRRPCYGVTEPQTTALSSGNIRLRTPVLPEMLTRLSSAAEVAFVADLVNLDTGQHTAAAVCRLQIASFFAASLSLSDMIQAQRTDLYNSLKTGEGKSALQAAVNLYVLGATAGGASAAVNASVQLSLLGAAVQGVFAVVNGRMLHLESGGVLTGTTRSLLLPDEWLSSAADATAAGTTSAPPPTSTAPLVLTPSLRFSSHGAKATAVEVAAGSMLLLRRLLLSTGNGVLVPPGTWNDVADLAASAHTLAWSAVSSSGGKRFGAGRVGPLDDFPSLLSHFGAESRLVRLALRCAMDALYVFQGGLGRSDRAAAASRQDMATGVDDVFAYLGILAATVAFTGPSFVPVVVGLNPTFALGTRPIKKLSDMYAFAAFIVGMKVFAGASPRWISMGMSGVAVLRLERCCTMQEDFGFASLSESGTLSLAAVNASRKLWKYPGAALLAGQAPAIAIGQAVAGSGTALFSLNASSGQSQSVLVEVASVAVVLLKLTNAKLVDLSVRPEAAARVEGQPALTMWTQRLPSGTNYTQLRCAWMAAGRSPSIAAMWSDRSITTVKIEPSSSTAPPSTPSNGAQVIVQCSLPPQLPSYVAVVLWRFNVPAPPTTTLSADDVRTYPPPVIVVPSTDNASTSLAIALGSIGGALVVALMGVAVVMQRSRASHILQAAEMKRVEERQHEAEVDAANRLLDPLLVAPAARPPRGVTSSAQLFQQLKRSA